MSGVFKGCLGGVYGGVGGLSVGRLGVCVLGLSWGVWGGVWVGVWVCLRCVFGVSGCVWGVYHGVSWGVSRGLYWTVLLSTFGYSNSKFHML